MNPVAPLESSFGPATFLVSSSALTLRDALEAPAQDTATQISSQTIATSTVALLLAQGGKWN